VVRVAAVIAQVLGGLLLVAGIGMWSLAAALVAAGILLLAAGTLAERASA
jgi:hypothetical protein